MPKSFNPRIEIQTKEKWYVPVLVGKIRWHWSRAGAPGKLEFTVKKDAYINFQNGAVVLLKVNDKPIFRGFVFTKRRGSGVNIDCVAYDQLRYLKTKTTMKITDATAAGFVRYVAKINNLEVGDVDGYKKDDDLEKLKLPTYIAENKEWLEVLDHIAAQHTILTGEVIVLYDDAGKICFRNILNMQITDQVFTAPGMEDWKYETTIDHGTYNSIVVDYIQEEGDAPQPVVKEDEKRIADWGVLRYHTKSNEPKEVIESKADKLLKVLCREVRTLQLKNVVGNLKVRGGSLVVVRLPLGDQELFAWMIVKDVVHTIKGNKHSMDMTVENNKLGFAPAINPEGIFKMIKKEKDGEGGDGGSRLPGNTNEEKTWNALIDAGFKSPAVRAGIMGNMHRETGGTFDPAIIQGAIAQNGKVIRNGRGPGRGLCQWESAALGGSGRWEPLVAWCRAKGLGPESFEGQCRFIMHELTDPKSWINNTAMSYYAKMTADQFLSLTDVEKATLAFLQGYEIGPPAAVAANFSKSIGPARTYYDRWKDYGSGKVGGGKGTGNIGWPIAGGGGTIMQKFGPTKWDKFHRGWDISTTGGNGAGSKVVAVDGGTVVSAGWQLDDASYGNAVTIDHGNGLCTRYAHLWSIDPSIRSGVSVSKGQVLGIEGGTGYGRYTFGTHLHIEFLKSLPWGALIDPARYLKG